jgi:peroxiredoxin
LPIFELPDLEGRPHSSSDYLGRILLSYIWSARCPQCKRADEVLLSRKRAWPQEVEVLAIASNADEAREEIQKEAQARQIETVLLDPGARIADLYGANVTPFFFVSDVKGILRYRGALDDLTFRQRVPHINYVDRALAAVLEGKSPDPSETPGYGCALVRFASGS